MTEGTAVCGSVVTSCCNPFNIVGTRQLAARLLAVTNRCTAPTMSKLQVSAKSDRHLAGLASQRLRTAYQVRNDR
jgi:hypothetical protein